MENDWLKKCNEWKKMWDGENSYHVKFRHSNFFSIYDVIKLINDYSKLNNVFLFDAGSPSYVCPVNLKIRKGQRIISSPSQADMGWAIPASVGVSLADRARRPVVIVGDGSCMSNMQELAAIKAHNLPIKIIVLNNDGYLSIKNTQKK